MMPKTVAYLMIVVLGYIHFVNKFESKNILGLSYTFLVMGFIGGVFYREFTKLYEFQDKSHLSIIHVHTLVLGFLLMLILYMILKSYDEDTIAMLKKPIYVYVSGFTFTVVNMIVFGIYEVVSGGNEIVSRPALEAMSGIVHIVLSIGIVWIIVKIFKIESEKTINKLKLIRNT